MAGFGKHHGIPAVFMRGGTSKGVVIRQADLPAERARWDPIFLSPQAAGTLSGESIAPESVDLTARMISNGQPHLALPLTASLCTAVAARIPGTLVNRSTRRETAVGGLRIGMPSGVLTVDAARVAGIRTGERSRRGGVQPPFGERCGALEPPEVLDPFERPGLPEAPGALEPETPSAASVAWSRRPVGGMFCCFWYSSRAVRVFGPMTPSAVPTSCPFASSASCARRTVSLDCPAEAFGAAVPPIDLLVEALLS